MKRMTTGRIVCTFGAAFFLIQALGWGLLGCGNGLPESDRSVDPPEEEVSVLRAKDLLADIYFGEVHGHTALSVDAFLGQRVFWPDSPVATPCAAYIYARGIAGLDFVALNDHAEEPTPVNDFLMDQAADMIEEVIQGLPEEVRGLLVPDHRVDIPERIREALEAQCSQPYSAEMLEGFTTWSLQTDIARRFSLSQGCEERDPGCLIVFPGFEHTGEAYGHKNVVFKSLDAVPEKMFSSQQLDENMELVNIKPQALWEWLECHRDGKGGPACGDVTLGPDYDYLTVVHTPAEGELHDTDWDELPEDVEVETEGTVTKYPLKGRAMPLGEMFSKHGNSECADGESCYEPIPDQKPEQTFSPQMGQWVTSGDENLMLGVIAGTDSHSGRPGDVEKNNVPYHDGTDYDVECALRTMTKGGGITGVLAPSRSREAIFDALKHKRTYGTSGPKLRLIFSTVSEETVPVQAWMGDRAQASEQGSVAVHLLLVAMPDTAEEVAAEEVDFVKNGDLAHPIPAIFRIGPDGEWIARTTVALAPSEARAYYYGRVHMGRPDPGVSGGPLRKEMAWSSPIWVER